MMHHKSTYARNILAVSSDSRPPHGWPSEVMCYPEWALVALCPISLRRTATQEEAPDDTEDDEDEDQVRTDNERDRD